MQRIEFKTSIGKITFAKGSKYLFTNFNPNDGDTEYQTDTYIDQDGETILNSTYNARKLTLSGNIFAENEVEMYKLRKDMTRIMNGKDRGVLRYFDGQNQYMTECIASLPDFGNHIVNKALPFDVDLNLYNFYWKSDKISKVNVYSRIDNLYGTFSFPADDTGMVITSRSSKANVQNGGDTATPLIITISATKINASAYTGQGFIIKNNATIKFIKLDYDMSNGEVVTIDTDNTTITSSINGNIIYALSEDSEFFTATTGKNEIECLKYDNTVELTANVQFYKRYVGV